MPSLAGIALSGSISFAGIALSGSISLAGIALSGSIYREKFKKFSIFYHCILVFLPFKKQRLKARPSFLKRLLKMLSAQ